MPHRLESSALVALLECVRLGDPSEQADRQDDNIFFTIRKGILRPRQRTLE